MAEPNWAAQTVWTADNLHVMRGMNSASVDLVYLDPPFNSKTDYAAPIGSAAAGAAFKDTWTLTDIDAEWINLMEDRHPAVWRVLLAAMTASDKSYLAYMAVRLLEIHRLLKPCGSLWLHCDPTMSHYLKLLLDAIFGRRQMLNEIVWAYTGPGNVTRHFKRKHDVILYYARGTDWTFNTDAVRVPYSDATLLRRRYTEGDTGIAAGLSGSRDESTVQAEFGGGKVPEDWWTDIPTGGQIPRSERVGYPTQKPLRLLHRIITASSNPGDLVFDPFCGCATTLVAAHDLTRNWAGIDISAKAAELVVERIADRQGLFSGIVHRTDLPKRTDLGTPPPTTAPPTVNTSTAPSPATAQDAAPTSRPDTWRWITSSLSPRAAPTTSTTSSCCAATATGSRATAGWSTCEPGCNSARPHGVRYTSPRREERDGIHERNETPQGTEGQLRRRHPRASRSRCWPLPSQQAQRGPCFWERHLSRAAPRSPLDLTPVGLRWGLGYQAWQSPPLTSVFRGEPTTPF